MTGEKKTGENVTEDEFKKMYMGDFSVGECYGPLPPLLPFKWPSREVDNDDNADAMAYAISLHWHKMETIPIMAWNEEVKKREEQKHSKHPVLVETGDKWLNLNFLGGAEVGLEDKAEKKTAWITEKEINILWRPVNTSKDYKKKMLLAKQLEQAARNAAIKKEKEAAREARSWKFNAPCSESLDLNEIAKTLDRENPVAYVEQEEVVKPLPKVKKVKPAKGEKKVPPPPPQKTPFVPKPAFVLVHRSIMRKALDVGIVADFNIEALKCGHYCAEVSRKEMSYILNWCKKVQYAKWNKKGVKVSVRYPGV